MDEILENLKLYFKNNPEHVYSIIGILFTILFVGALKNKKWAIDPESSSQRFFYNTFGHNAFKKLISIVYFLGALAGYSGYYLYTVKKQKDDTLLIHHLPPNEIINAKNKILVSGEYSKRRNDFFVLKNFNYHNEKHKIKVDSFVVNYLKKDSFLLKNDNVKWSLFFFKYGDGITEKTKHIYNTDYTIHKLFAFEKRLVSYHFNNTPNYKNLINTSYYLQNGDSIIDEKREIILTHFNSLN